MADVGELRLKEYPYMIGQWKNLGGKVLTGLAVLDQSAC